MRLTLHIGKQANSAGQMVKEEWKQQIKPDVLNSLKIISVLCSVTGLS